MSNWFCPHCQADWAQPWYDQCPACKKRLSPSARKTNWLLVIGYLCLPALSVLVSDYFWGNDAALFIVVASFGGTGLMSLLATLQITRGLDRKSKLSGFLGWLLFVPICYVVSFSLCFFSCTMVL